MNPFMSHQYVHTPWRQHDFTMDNHYRGGNQIRPYDTPKQGADGQSPPPFVRDFWNLGKGQIAPSQNIQVDLNETDSQEQVGVQVGEEARQVGIDVRDATNGGTGSVDGAPVTNLGLFGTRNFDFVDGDGPLAFSAFGLPGGPNTIDGNRGVEIGAAFGGSLELDAGGDAFTALVQGSGTDLTIEDPSPLTFVSVPTRPVGHVPLGDGRYQLHFPGGETSVVGEYTQIALSDERQVVFLNELIGA